MPRTHHHHFSLLYFTGSLNRDFKHLSVDMYLIEEDGVKKLRVDCHLGKRKALAALRTCTSHVANMITGVTKGFEYKMRLVYGTSFFYLHL